MKNVNQQDQLNLIASFQTEELEARLEFKKWKAAPDTLETTISNEGASATATWNF